MTVYVPSYILSMLYVAAMGAQASWDKEDILPERVQSQKKMSIFK